MAITEFTLLIPGAGGFPLDAGNMCEAISDVDQLPRTHLPDLASRIELGWEAFPTGPPKMKSIVFSKKAISESIEQQINNRSSRSDRQRKSIMENRSRFQKAITPYINLRDVKFFSFPCFSYF